MKMSRLPWEYNSDLIESRLIEMANFIAGVRDEVIDLHDDLLGDTRLALGMRAYECCRTRIKRVANSKLFPWLSILTPEGRFTFLINNTPVRFTRNDPKYLPDNKLIFSDETMQQMALLDESPSANIRWFFVFDTDYKSAADAVYFVGYDEFGDIVCQWQIPIEAKVTLISDASNSMPLAVELDEPLVAVKQKVTSSDKRSNE